MRLNQLLAGVALTERRVGDVECSGICYDTRTMEPGCLFVALPGYKTDGHKYIAQARTSWRKPPPGRPGRPG